VARQFGATNADADEARRGRIMQAVFIVIKNDIAEGVL
jgi:hypothetical protein